MPTARLGLCTAVVEGRIYAIGGYAAAGEPGLQTVEAYDPATDTWTSKAPMPTQRRWLACSVADGTIYAVGGHRNERATSLSTVEAYDVASDTWTTRTPMSTARRGGCTAVVDGRIYAIGGADVNVERVATVEVYDPATDSWASKNDIPTARALFSCAVVDGIIYAIGGPWPGSTGASTVEAYDPASDTWTTKNGLPTGRWGLAASVIEGKIYAIGGASGGLTAFPIVEEYDPATDSWAVRSSMPENDQVDTGARWGLSSSTVNGHVYVIGGSAFPIPHPGSVSVQAYTPPTPTDIEDLPDAQPLPGHTAHLNNYPNPFTTSTAIRFELPRAQPAQLVVYDVLGRAVQVLIDGVRPAGRQEVVFGAAGLPGGVYLYRLEIPGGSSTGTMLLVQ
jgi:N-acetylneuraminic acid mutarotase